MKKENIDLTTSKAKIARSKKHFDELTSALKIYLASQPYTIERITNDATGDVSDIVRVKKEIPEDWSYIAGDIVHNLRASLDYLVTSLVEVNGNSASKSNCFPIDNSLEDYQRNSPKKLIGLNADAVEFINSLKPYKNGEDILWRLHKLDIQDKHRRNLIVGAANRSVNITMKMDFAGEQIKFPTIALIPADTQFPLVDRKPLFGFNKKTAGAHDFNDNGYTFEIHFSGDQIFNEREILVTLRELIQYVDRVLDDAIKI